MILVPISELQHALFTPEVLWTRERTPTLSFIISTSELAFESVKKFGGASHNTC
jgi:hypothetical protein